MACRQPGWAAGALRVARALGAALVGLAAAIAGLGALGTHAGADQIETAKAQVAALEAQAVKVAGQVHTWTVRYNERFATSLYLRHQADLTRSELLALRAGLARTKSVLQEEALLAYTNVLPSMGVVTGAQGTAVDDLERATYQRVAAGDISKTLDVYGAQASAVETALTSYERQLSASLAAVRVAAEARAQALSEARGMQALVDQANLKVARLEAVRKAAIGPPVGDGIVRAVMDQLNGVPQAPADPLSPPAAHPSTTIVNTSTTLSGGSPTTGVPTLATRLVPAPTTSPSSTLPSTTTGATTTTTSAPPHPPTTTTTTALPTTVPPTTAAPPTTSPPTTAAPPTTVPPTTDAGAHPPPLGGVWLELRECESGDDYAEDTGNGYYGAYQFSEPTWAALGYPGRPDLEPYWLQDQAAQRLEAAGGWGQWPACSAALGL
ncbi:MAG TPA: transglycosylase family protein [Acidimicrobiales bacterium]|nr:transglycosylase family protein [Acidimicrobiales bacterium]